MYQNIQYDKSVFNYTLNIRKLVNDIYNKNMCRYMFYIHRHSNSLLYYIIKILDVSSISQKFCTLSLICLCKLFKAIYMFARMLRSRVTRIFVCSKHRINLTSFIYNELSYIHTFVNLLLVHRRYEEEINQISIDLIIYNVAPKQ